MTPRVSPTKKPTISSTSATRIAISTSGNDPHGDGGRSRAPRLGAGGRAGRRLDSVAASRASRRVVGGRNSPDRRLRRLRALAAIARPGFGVTAARRPRSHGQPEEILTRHQPISMPIRPSRGRECQYLQPGSPMSAFEMRTHLKRDGSATISSMRSTFFRST